MCVQQKQQRQKRQHRQIKKVHKATNGQNYCGIAWHGICRGQGDLIMNMIKMKITQLWLNEPLL